VWLKNLLDTVLKAVASAKTSPSAGRVVGSCSGAHCEAAGLQTQSTLRATRSAALPYCRHYKALP